MPPSVFGTKIIAVGDLFLVKLGTDQKSCLVFHKRATNWREPTDPRADKLCSPER